MQFLKFFGHFSSYLSNFKKSVVTFVTSNKSQKLKKIKYQKIQINIFFQNHYESREWIWLQ